MIEKFLSHTIKDGECLVWTRCFNSDGYPRALYKGNPNGKVHRIVCELSTGRDLSGLVVRHTCDNPKCINPDHLIPGTASQNTKDMDERDRRFRVITEDKVTAVKELNKTGLFNKKQIAGIVGIDQRRVCEIILGKRDNTGRLVKS